MSQKFSLHIIINALPINYQYMRLNVIALLILCLNNYATLVCAYINISCDVMRRIYNDELLRLL